MSVCIHSLPYELLLLIFSYGCGDKPRLKCIPRNRKPFARLVRQVCSQWRAIADNPANPHFWVAHLLLEISNEDAKPIAGRFYPIHPVKRLIDFRHCLTSSDGCDLMLSILLPTGTEWVCSIGELSPDADLVLRLLLHGMQLILPYQSQIANIEIEGNVPLVWSRIISLIMIEFKTAQILEGIHLKPGEFSFNMPQSISEVLSLSAAGFGQLRPHSINQTNLPLSIKHLPRLNTLTLPYASWLNTRELKLNSSISHLEISMCPSQDSLIELLGTGVNVFKNLVTLTIGSERSNRVPYPDGYVNRYRYISSRLPSPLQLPRLTSISLLYVHPNWANLFFKCTDTPLLESANLNLIHGDEDLDGITTAQDLETEYPGNDATARMTSLLTLTIFTHISWNSLQLLKKLANPSIEKLNMHIWVSMDRERKPPGEDLLRQMAEVLSRLEPCSLHLDRTSHRSIQYIIRCINLQRIQFLEIKLDERSAGRLPDVSNYFFLAHKKLPITLPSLSELKLECNDPDLSTFFHFLILISANMLKRVCLSSGYYPTPGPRNITVSEGDLVGKSTPFSPSRQLLSVEEIEVTMRYSNLPDIWKLTPNVHSLNISIKPFIIIDPVECINSVVDQFIPKENHSPLLPFLQLFSLTYTTRRRRVNSKELNQSVSPNGELHDSIKKVFNTRAEFGAIPLELKPIQLELIPGDDVSFHGPHEILTIKIIAKVQ